MELEGQGVGGVGEEVVVRWTRRAGSEGDGAADAVAREAGS
jgi:hypothetical protein